MSSCLILKEGSGMGFVQSDPAAVRCKVQECLSVFPAKIRQGELEVMFKHSGHAELLSIATSNSSKR